MAALPAAHLCLAMFFAVVMMLALFCFVGAADDIIIGELDGTHKLTIKDITDGFDGGAKNYVKKCGLHDALGDNFVLTITMGSFVDHLVPKRGVTVCGLLTSTSREQKYLYAPMDPREPSWDGRTSEITPSLYDAALGGSEDGYASGGRSTLSFWGDNGDDENHLGGCCALSPGQPPAWYRPYRLSVTPKDNAFYFAWGTEPKLVVRNSPVVFEVNAWNMHGELFDGVLKLEITINGVKWLVKSPTGRCVHYAEAPDAKAKNYSVIVDLVAGPKVLNTKQLRMVADVFDELPWDVTPVPEGAIPDLVHFGGMGVAIGPVEKEEALDEDWFAPTVVGGEAAIRPIAGHYNTAQVHTAFPKKEMWKNVSATDSVFCAKVPCKSLQFYAFAFYSATDQRVVIEYVYDTAAVMYISGRRFASRKSGGVQQEFFPVEVTKGYHQVLVKLFSDNRSTMSVVSNCTVESTFWVRVVGTAVGYTHAVMPGIMEGSYELWNNHYMFYLLHPGKNADDYFYGGIDEDFINIKSVIPRDGDPIGDKVWTPVVFYGGHIPVSAKQLPKGKEAAVSYVTFALYNAYEEEIPLSWSFSTGGKCDFFMDGVNYYNTTNSSVSVTQNFTTPISPGWHQSIVRIAATEGQSWGLTFIIRFDNYRVWGAAHPTTALPFGVAPVRSNVPLVSMMELIDGESNSGAVPFDPLNKTVTQETFSDLPIGEYYWPALLSTQSISVVGRERQFVWSGVRNPGGVWGHDVFGGDSNQYWAAAFYATMAMHATLRIVVNGAYAVWLNGKVIGSGPLSDPKDKYHAMELDKGWNQMIVKLRAMNTFYMVDTMNHKITWTMAHAACAAKGNLTLCPSSAVCPLGVGRPGTVPLSGGSSFVPVSDGKNEWVQVSATGGNNTALCQTWQATHHGRGPPWGESGADVAERHLVPCCGGGLPPSLWLSVNYTRGARVELGYTYEVPLIVERPVVHVSSQVSLTRDVMITSATPTATIKYAIDDTEDMVEYTGPFQIRKSTTITAQAFAYDRESQLVRLWVNIPQHPFVDRERCVADKTCPLLVSGVDAGQQMCVLNQASSKKLKFFLDLDYAKQQQRSPNFSGVVAIDANNSVIIPPLGAGTFYLIVYDDSGKGFLLANHLPYEKSVLSPTSVVGTAQTAFTIHGGVMAGDAVLIPFGPTGSPATCDAETCAVELGQNRVRVVLLRNVGLGNFLQDMYGFAGDLNCLCMCLSCAAAGPEKDELLVETARVVPLAITLHVSMAPVPREATVEEVFPLTLRDGDILAFAGKFDTDSSYSVRFVAAGFEGDKRVAPVCAVQKFSNVFVTCKMLVRVANMGQWNLELMNGDKSIPFADKSARLRHVYSPSPSFKYISGACADASSRCVDGAVLTFHGANFSPLMPVYNDVVIGDGDSDHPIECLVSAANETHLSCALVVPRDKLSGVFPVRVRTKVFNDKFSPDRDAGYLQLGAGPDVPGWRLLWPPSPPASFDWGNKTVIILGIVFGTLACVLLLVILAVVVYYRANKANNGAEDHLELRLLYADRDTVRSTSQNSDNEKLF